MADSVQFVRDHIDLLRKKSYIFLQTRVSWVKQCAMVCASLGCPGHNGHLLFIVDLFSWCCSSIGTEVCFTECDGQVMVCCTQRESYSAVMCN
jgi:hypothetical protein